MTNFIFKIAATAAVLSTSACISLPQGPEQFANGPGQATLDTATGELSLNGRVVSRDNDTTVRSNGQARVTRDAAGVAFTARATDGATYAVAAVTRSGEPNSGAVYGRSDSLTLPVSGRATMSGDYVGLLSANTGRDNQSVTRIIDGDATIIADFGTGRVRGAITNRVVSTTNGNTLTSWRAQPMSINETDIENDGTFAMTTTGGTVTSAFNGYAAQTGRVTGIFGGDDAESVAGHLRVDHRGSTGFTYQENGAFVAN